MRKKYYAGIGSRSVPEHVLDLMTALATKLEKDGYTLRSGDAVGSDRAFQAGVKNSENMEIFLSKHGHIPWALVEVKNHLPNDRSNFDSWRPYVQGLLARNMMQVLGYEGNKPIEFIVCYTHSTEYNTSKCGGTGYAIRCALARNIPVYNMLDKYVFARISNLLKYSTINYSFNEFMFYSEPFEVFTCC